MTQLTVTIPEEYVLITREEYNELQEKEKQDAMDTKIIKKMQNM